MKKLMSLLLVLVLALSMGTVAFAATEKDNQNPTFTVTYQLDEEIKSGEPLAFPEGIVAPKQTFTYTITARDVKETTTVTQAQMPQIASVTAAFTADDKLPTSNASTQTETVTINLTDIQWPGVGVYYYDVAQSVNNEALGVNYSNAAHTLKVTVYQDANQRPYVAFVTLNANLNSVGENGVTTDKSNGFTNTYTANNLSVKKEVTGNMGDQDKVFNVDVTFTAANTLSSAITYTDDNSSATIAHDDENWATNPGAGTKSITKTITLKHDETVTFQNLPAGVTYTVKEKDYTTEEGGNYDAAKYTKDNTVANAIVKPDGETDTMQKTAQNVLVVNNKGINVDTGVLLDSLPYILMLAFAVIGLAVFFVKRRTAREN